MKKLENLGRKLSKVDQKRIIGGNPPSGGNTFCASPGTVCHTEGPITYTCSITYHPDGTEDECCCSHSGYNDNCLAT